MDSLKIKLDDINEIRYNGQFKWLKQLQEEIDKDHKRLIIDFNDGSTVIVIGDMATEFHKKLQDIRKHETTHP